MSALPDRRLPRRLTQLYVGLVAFAFGEALIVRANLGVMSWDVLHQGLARHLGLSIGQWSVIVGALVLLLWIPLRERPGLGTVSNVLVIGLALDLFLRWLSAPVSLSARVALLVTGILINGLATAAYVGASLGPGPRDGLMTGLVRTTRQPVGLVRTAIEASVVLVGAGCSAATSRSARWCSSSRSGRWCTCSCRCSPSAAGPPAPDPAAVSSLPEIG